MDILDMLTNNQEELYLDDLDYFETELAIGEYNSDYKEKCLEKIALIRVKLRNKSSKNKYIITDVEKVMDIEEKFKEQELKDDDDIFHYIRGISSGLNYKTELKQFVKETDKINQDFVERYITEFKEEEIEILTEIVQFDEEFLEKYFKILNKKAISRYQYFSENFFMNHYLELDGEIVLTKGVNDWKNKNKRSNQLDIFLRLKGVTL